MHKCKYAQAKNKLWITSRDQQAKQMDGSGSIQNRAVLSIIDLLLGSEAIGSAIAT